MKLRAVVLSVLMVLSIATVGATPAAAQAAGNASVSPSAVEFSETAVGDTATEDVTITNDGGGDIEVTGVEVTGRNDSQFTVTSGASGGTIGSGESLTATVEYAPDDFHEHSATLTVSYADGTTSEVPLSEADTSLTLSGTVTDYVGGVEGATVRVDGTDTETTTAADGSYSLTVSEPSVDLNVIHTFPDGNSFTQTLSVELDGDTTRDITHVPSIAELPGDGTADDPYEIATVRELQAMEGDLDANYILFRDINATRTDQWNDGAGFAPVGGLDSSFTGSFDGRNYNVSNLTVNRSRADEVGLFGAVGTTGTVENVTLGDVNVSGLRSVGGLVGENRGAVRESSATANVSGSSRAGGLVGENTGTVRESSATGNVSGSDYVGGLVGENTGTVRESSATGNVSGTGFVGGLVGENRGAVRESSATGHVNGFSGAGGLVGRNVGTMRESSATGNVDGDNSVGGLVGENEIDSVVRGSSATGKVNGSLYVGGLVGENEPASIVNESSATGNVDGDNYVGGLVGHVVGGDIENNGSTVRASYATGDVSGFGYVGGLVGVNGGSESDDGAVNESYATGTVSISGNEFDNAGGGLIGENGGTVRRSYATGTVSATDSVENVGGLVGDGRTDHNGTVNNSYWDTESTGQDSSFGDGATGLTTAQMTGGAPAVNMENLTYYDTWVLVDGEYPRLAWSVDRGAGTAADPFEVSNAGELQAIEDNRSASYVLTGDIDASATSGWDDGAGLDPIGGDPPFSGTFDGDGHTVSNLTIDRPGETRVGLFGAVTDGTVRNVALDDATVNGSDRTGSLVGIIESLPVGGGETTVRAVTVTDSTVDGRIDTGGVVGVVESNLTNASVSGVTVSGDDAVGGLVGENTGTVEESTTETTVEGTERTGGAVGVNLGTVSFVTANGSVEADSKVGGLVGDNSGTIEQTYAVAVVSGDSDTGGLVGTVGGTVSASYWDTTVSEPSGEESGIGLTTAEMTGVSAVSNMTRFDFENEWALIDGYPVLAERYDGEPPAPFVVTISDTNAPVLTGETLTVDATVSNAGADTATDQLTLLGVGGSEVDSTDVTLLADGTTDVTLTWTPSTAQSGDVTVAGLVTDETVPVSVETSEAVFDATITDTNDTVTAGETVAVEYEVTNDGASGAEQTIGFTVDGEQVGSETVTLLDGESTTGTFTYTSTASDAPSLTVGIESDDDSATRGVSVNRAPTATADGYTLTAGETLTVAADGLLANDTDPDGDPLSVSTTPVAAPSNGTLVLDADGSFEYTPDEGFSGEDSFTYEMSDDDGGTDTATVTITVTESTAGTADFVVDITDVNSSVTAGEDIVVGYTVENTGEATGTQDITFTVDGTQVAVDTDVRLDSGGLTADSFTYTTGASDTPSVDVAVASENESATRSLSVDARETNDPPVAGDDTYTTTANETLSVAAPGVLDNDSDADGDTLTAAVSAAPSNGTVNLNTNGSFEYTPDSGFSGEDSFTYEVQDGNGGTDTATVTIRVVETAEPPNLTISITDTNAPVTEGETLSVTASVTNIGERADSQPATLEAFNGSEVDTRTVTLVAGNETNVTLAWETSEGDAGDGGVTVRTENDTATRSVSVEEADGDDETSGSGGGGGGRGADPNDPPDATDDAYTVVENTTLTVAAENGVLDNDTDPDGDTLSATVESGPTNGTLSLAENGSFVYTPDLGFAGTDSFTYEVSDGDGSDDTAAVNITVMSETVSWRTPPAFDDETIRLAVGEERALTVSDARLSAGEIARYEWSVDGEDRSGETTTLAFEDAGEYTVELSVTNGAGQTATTTTTVVVENETESVTTDSETPARTPDSSSEPPTTTDATTTSGNGPGFGALVALVALIGAMLLVNRKCS